MAVDPQYRRLPFREAIAFLRDKVTVPTETWLSLQREMHDWAFGVAGVVKAEILAAFREALVQALEEGTTLQDFRRDFDRIVAEHGWSYRGTRAWRTAMIYRTNLATAHAAGRYRQMTDPDVLAARPLWLYRHGDSLVPRAQHLAWDGLVLPASHPWWQTHFPPNGFGCSCRVFALSREEAAARGLAARAEPPPDGSYEHADPVTGEIRQIPTGIDPGFDYAPGASLPGARAQVLQRALRRLPADLRALAEAEIEQG